MIVSEVAPANQNQRKWVCGLSGKESGTWFENPLSKAFPQDFQGDWARELCSGLLPRFLRLCPILVVVAQPL